MTAKITTVKKGRHKGEFKFTLYAVNGEPVAQSYPETYKTLQSCKKTLASCFPAFILSS